MKVRVSLKFEMDAVAFAELVRKAKDDYITPSFDGGQDSIAANAALYAFWAAFVKQVKDSTP